MQRGPLALALLAVALILSSAAARPAAAAWPTSPGANLPVRVAVGGVGDYVMLPDGSGGAFLAWDDQRTSGTTGDDIYAAHILASGAMDPLWPANGVVVCNAAGNQDLPQMVSDGAGGVIIAWQDLRNPTWDIYASRLTSAGTRAPGWPANGTQVGATTPPPTARDDIAPQICTDGAGGAIVVWTVIYTPGTDNDLYANRVLANGTIAPGWFATGNVVNGVTGIQDEPTIVSDGAGGAIIAYRDIFFTPNAQIRYRTMSASGVSGIPVWGDLVNGTGQTQNLPMGISDGLGGMFLMWQDADVVPWGIAVADITPVGPGGSIFASQPIIHGKASDYCWPVQIVLDGNGGVYLAFYDQALGYHVHLTHVSGNAVPGPGWDEFGVGIGLDRSSAIVPDGTGGVIAAYSDFYDVFAQRYLQNATYPTGWTATTTVSNASNVQVTPVAVSDGQGGIITAWLDERDQYRGMFGIYAQRVDRFGTLGDAAPAIAGVKDTPNDQGGHVRVSWNPSYLDAEPVRGVSSYYVYRQLPTGFAAKQLAAGRLQVAADGAAAGQPGTVRVTRDAVQSYYWEQIANVPAMQLSGYSYEAATASDSVPGSNPYTLFMVEAAASSGAYWMSAPDSGYSKDNLPPLPPAPVSAAYSGSATTLHWAPNGEADLANYRIYRGGSSFVPGPSNLVASPTDTNYVDATSYTYVYKISAVDAHGNESAFTTITPSGVLDAPTVAAHELAFAIASRNPSPGSVTFRLSMPRESDARIVLFDALGRRVRTLTSGRQPAGDQVLRWDGSDESGRPSPSGLYFARFDGLGSTMVRRLVIER